LTNVETKQFNCDKQQLKVQKKEKQKKKKYKREAN